MELNSQNRLETKRLEKEDFTSDVVTLVVKNKYNKVKRTKKSWGSVVGRVIVSQRKVK